MKIAVASGKGGAGKTFLAVNLAWTAPSKVRLLDCDVEAPNAALLVQPELRSQEPVSVLVPALDPSLCTACGICSQICEYHAIAAVGREPLLFPELCHSCGGCVLACPTRALREVEREVGVVETGERDGRTIVTGRLHVGQALSPPVIRAVKRRVDEDAHHVVDCPPGASCQLVAAVSGCDFVLLVAEPTPFGIHDLEIAADAVARMGLPMGVVVNRAGPRDWLVHRLCERKRLPVLCEILESRAIRVACAEGTIAVDTMPELRATLERLWQDLLSRAGGAAHAKKGPRRVDVRL